MIVTITGNGGKENHSTQVAASLAGMTSLIFNKKTLLIQLTGIDAPAVEEIYSGLGDKDNFFYQQGVNFVNEGVDSLVYAAGTDKLGISEFEQMTIAVRNENRLDVAGKTKSNQFVNLLDKNTENVKALLSYAKDAYDYVYVLLPESNFAFSKEINSMEIVNYCLYCVDQRAKELAPVTGDNVILVVPDFDTYSANTVKILQKRWNVGRMIKVRKINYCTGEKDAMDEQRLLQFIATNRDIEEEDINYNWSRDVKALVSEISGKIMDEITPDYGWEKRQPYVINTTAEEAGIMPKGYVWTNEDKYFNTLKCASVEDFRKYCVEKGIMSAIIDEIDAFIENYDEILQEWEDRREPDGFVEIIEEDAGDGLEEESIQTETNEEQEESGETENGEVEYEEVESDNEAEEAEEDEEEDDNPDMLAQTETDDEVETEDPGSESEPETGEDEEEDTTDNEPDDETEQEEDSMEEEGSVDETEMEMDGLKNVEAVYDFNSEPTDEEEDTEDTENTETMVPEEDLEEETTEDSEDNLGEESTEVPEETVEEEEKPYSEESEDEHEHIDGEIIEKKEDPISPVETLKQIYEQFGQCDDSSTITVNHKKKKKKKKKKKTAVQSESVQDAVPPIDEETLFDSDAKEEQPPSGEERVIE